MIEEPDAHHGRYQMPVLPVFLVYVAIGIGRLARALRGVRAGLDRLELGVRALVVGGGAVSFVFFALAYGDQSLPCLPSSVVICQCGTSSPSLSTSAK